MDLVSSLMKDWFNFVLTGQFSTQCAYKVAMIEMLISFYCINKLYDHPYCCTSQINFSVNIINVLFNFFLE